MENQIKAMWSRAKRQLAVDFACSPEDFDKEENMIVAAAELPGCRKFGTDPVFLQLACFRKGAVLSADPILHPFLKQFCAGHLGREVFDLPMLKKLDQELQIHSQGLGGIHIMYLPVVGKEDVEADFKVRWFEREAIPSFYSDSRWSNALSFEKASFHPDMLAVAAYDDDGALAGMAGASADSEEMWQIGIDVLPAFRGHGMGGTLVRLLKQEILRRGRIPYYGTSPANISSQNVARVSGFSPAWTGIYSISKEP